MAINILFKYIWAVTWDFQQCDMCDQQRLRPACAYAQSDQSLCLSLEYSRSVKLLTEHHLQFLSLKGGCTGLSESTLVKIPHCWKSHVAAHLAIVLYEQVQPHWILSKFMINVMMMFLALHPMESKSLNSFVMLEHLAMLLTSTLAINC